MTPRLTTDYAKNYCNRSLIVKVIVENVVTCFLWDTVNNYLGKERCDVGRNSKYLNESGFGYVWGDIHEAKCKTRALG